MKYIHITILLSINSAAMNPVHHELLMCVLYYVIHRTIAMQNPPEDIEIKEVSLL
jgi:hypothetical protein